MTNGSETGSDFGCYSLRGHLNPAASTQGGVISTITSPNDNRFIFKGKFTEQTTQNSQLSFSYSPIFFNNPTSGRMIEGFLDYLMHNTVFMTPMVVEGQPLLVGQSGIVLGEK
ncbi:hypothetical protein [Yersinia pseudotuberculosis]|uniref:hypothetical protein n=1 Tax=Yersinia pseudotuberculosis TaxID=633 RepID=UPI0004F64B68|nr:hypothetical protein DJ40_3103 [Yersinia pseudotuberculosis]